MVIGRGYMYMYVFSTSYMLGTIFLENGHYIIIISNFKRWAKMEILKT